MKCPGCLSNVSRVLESREIDEGAAIRRRRACEKCKNRYTTYERVEVLHLMIVKKLGDRETYSREKLARGIYRALEKRPITTEKIELLVSTVEQKLLQRGTNEIASKDIGEIVMQELLVLDDVAYVRFASVYRSFTDLESFEKALAVLKNNSHKE